SRICYQGLDSRLYASLEDLPWAVFEPRAAPLPSVPFRLELLQNHPAVVFNNPQGQQSLNDRLVNVVIPGFVRSFEAGDFAQCLARIQAWMTSYIHKLRQTPSHSTMHPAGGGPSVRDAASGLLIQAGHSWGISVRHLGLIFAVCPKPVD